MPASPQIPVVPGAPEKRILISGTLGAVQLSTLLCDGGYLLTVTDALPQ